MKTPEQAAEDYLQEYERQAPAPDPAILPAAIRTAWRAYRDPDTPAELKDDLLIALDELTEMLYKQQAQAEQEN